MHCPACGAELETPLGCQACGALLDPEPLPGPYALFGLDRGYAVEAAELSRRLKRFSRLLHPDFHGTAGPEARERAERNSALLNEAYAELSDDARRAEGLVASLGGPSDAEERQMPQAFLMEVMEWNETLEELRAEPGDGAAQDRMKALRTELSERREATLGRVAAGLDPLPDKGSPLLTELRRELNAIRYLDRALGEIKTLSLAGARRT